LARKRAPSNGRDRLEEAMAMLIQNQAAFLNRLADTDSRIAESERHYAELRREASERFARIEADIAAILRVLAEHGRLLERLPDAVRDKIGFKGQ
jgi:GTP1/Obg family GTP-binding protein